VIGLADTSRAKTVPIPVPGVLTDDSPDDAVAPTKNERAVSLTLDAIKALPRVEMVTELKCIEGWSVVVQWAGARFADFVAKYPPQTESGRPPEYVSLLTPDGKYFVGLDMASAMHPQTLLCYEMNGAPLAQEHGAPLRLVTPVKYGIKHIKRIGVIRFTNERPIDYWAQRGYDWYAGH
jgi:DMSO/TMAO reductase YedYZ molybdopterin-dependent catalytic subunit